VIIGGALRRQPRLARCSATRGGYYFGLRPGGAAPPARGVYFARIIYALITVINNSGIEKQGRAAGGAAPPGEARKRGWRRNALFYEYTHSNINSIDQSI
jgi:hypothetical protein